MDEFVVLSPPQMQVEVKAPPLPPPHNLPKETVSLSPRRFGALALETFLKKGQWNWKSDSRAPKEKKRKTG